MHSIYVKLFGCDQPLGWSLEGPSPRSTLSREACEMRFEALAESVTMVPLRSSGFSRASSTMSSFGFSVSAGLSDALEAPSTSMLIGSGDFGWVALRFVSDRTDPVSIASSKVS